MNKETKNFLVSILGVAALIGYLLFIGFICANANETAKAETVETENKTDNYVYIICDVVDNYDEPNGIYATNLVCKMPNGKLHKYTIEDAPEGKVELVCFRTDNQDDYEAYEVVAVR